MTIARDKPWPVCAVCNKPVDELLEWVDYDTMRHWFGVKCHGAFEKTFLNQEELMQFRRGKVTFAMAFATKALSDGA